MLPKGPPRILKNRKKSVRAPLQNLPESPSRRDREKSGSRTLPETSPCASRTVNTMVLARSTKCFHTFFFITFGLLLAPFLPLRGHANHLGAEKERSKKNVKKTSPQLSQNVAEKRSNPDQIQTTFCMPWAWIGPGTAPGPQKHPPRTTSERIPTQHPETSAEAHTELARAEFPILGGAAMTRRRRLQYYVHVY